VNIVLQEGKDSFFSIIVGDQEFWPIYYYESPNGLPHNPNGREILLMDMLNLEQILDTPVSSLNNNYSYYSKDFTKSLSEDVIAKCRDPLTSLQLDHHLIGWTVSFENFKVRDEFPTCLREQKSLKSKAFVLREIKLDILTKISLKVDMAKMSQLTKLMVINLVCCQCCKISQL
jgi:hypothetical protein